jgi:hypothetical protein
MIDMLLRGIPVPVTVAGVAAATSVDLAPARGEIWVIAWAQGLHDDNGGARVCGFQLHDGTTLVNIGPGAAIANGVCIPLYQTNPSGSLAGQEWQCPLILNEVMHLTLAGVAIGGGKKLYINALVYKFRGIGPWSNA